YLLEQGLKLGLICRWLELPKIGNQCLKFCNCARTEIWVIDLSRRGRTNRLGRLWRGGSCGPVFAHCAREDGIQRYAAVYWLRFDKSGIVDRNIDLDLPHGNRGPKVVIFANNSKRLFDSTYFPII